MQVDDAAASEAVLAVAETETGTLLFVAMLSRTRNKNRERPTPGKDILETIVDAKHSFWTTTRTAVRCVFVCVPTLRLAFFGAGGR